MKFGSGISDLLSDCSISKLNPSEFIYVSTRKSANLLTKPVAKMLSPPNSLYSSLFDISSIKNDLHQI